MDVDISSPAVVDNSFNSTIIDWDAEAPSETIDSMWSSFMGFTSAPQSDDEVESTHDERENEEESKSEEVVDEEQKAQAEQEKKKKRSKRRKRSEPVGVFDYTLQCQLTDDELRHKNRYVTLQVCKNAESWFDRYPDMKGNVHLWWLDFPWNVMAQGGKVVFEDSMDNKTKCNIISKCLDFSAEHGLVCVVDVSMNIAEIRTSMKNEAHMCVNYWVVPRPGGARSVGKMSQVLDEGFEVLIIAKNADVWKYHTTYMSQNLDRLKDMCSMLYPDNEFKILQRFVVNYDPPCAYTRVYTPKGQPQRIQQKHVKLMCWFFALLTRPHEVIVDLVCGTGSAMLAAMMMQRVGHGYDRDGACVAAGNRWISWIVKDWSRRGIIENGDFKMAPPIPPSIALSGLIQHRTQRGPRPDLDLSTAPSNADFKGVVIGSVPQVYHSLDYNFKPPHPTGGQWPIYLPARGTTVSYQDDMEYRSHVANEFTSKYNILVKPSLVHGVGVFKAKGVGKILKDTRLPYAGYVWPTGFFLEHYGKLWPTTVLELSNRWVMVGDTRVPTSCFNHSMNKRYCKFKLHFLHHFDPETMRFADDIAWVSNDKDVKLAETEEELVIQYFSKWPKNGSSFERAYVDPGHIYKWGNNTDGQRRPRKNSAQQKKKQRKDDEVKEDDESETESGADAHDEDDTDDDDEKQPKKKKKPQRATKKKKAPAKRKASEKPVASPASKKKRKVSFADSTDVEKDDVLFDEGKAIMLANARDRARFTPPLFASDPTPAIATAPRPQMQFVTCVRCETSIDKIASANCRNCGNTVHLTSRRCPNGWPGLDLTARGISNELVRRWLTKRRLLSIKTCSEKCLRQFARKLRSNDKMFDDEFKKAEIRQINWTAELCGDHEVSEESGTEV